MGQTRRFAERMNLVAARLENRLASSGYCLGKAVVKDGDYLVFLPGVGEVEVEAPTTVTRPGVESGTPR
jgi:hypothetical protein